MKPVILVTSTWLPHPWNNKPAYIVGKDYMEAVVAGGGIPVLAGTAKLAEAYAEMADGLIITGGEGPHPRYYGETVSSMAENDLKNMRVMSSEFNPARDEMEIAILEAFIKLKKPVLGICRGHQLISVCTGGKVKLNFAKNDGVEHQGGVTHEIEVEQDSVLGKVFGTKFMINSFHYAKVASVSDEWRVTGYSPDGVIEAIEHKTLPMLGVQFHAERMCGEDRYPVLGPDSKPFFEHFIAMCTRK
ncbi:gamma-glutamyl-gamma-aminobutyrate hydrolase family protein [Fusibacter paucivorans]|uniref:Gamma-glutamyl-gamma-aminobutyrate hydrolase family protein n=1 Tax=Fusibacter paucivorans TaxID=76009 RepID=A0ABS5PR64_9FIRM|nr:gamma-glutamyl-gamma-aminobutyrate hydrolase family protein [Fusibacter paucivorans]MBS7527654.1 gamma-glutamyl-gamma-aminobutyrate hydrolase family protein [Fusibacter paucivorans]